MKVSNITTQKKHRDRYSVYIDDMYVCSLSGDALLKSGIQTGDVLTSEQKNALLQLSEQDLAYSRLLNLISRRPRSMWEAEQYLKKKGYDSTSIHSTISLLQQKGYLDDYMFAESWVRSRRLTRSMSQKKLRYELKQKRVADSTIDEILKTDDREDLHALKELVAKKRKVSRYKDDVKLMRYLAGQGFNYTDIKEVLSEAHDA